MSTIRLGFLFGIFIVFAGLAYIYRGAVLEGKILFPSNLLASFYSPWSTTTFPGWGRGIPNKPIGGNDQVRLFYPGRTVTNEAIKQGRVPLWNPYIFSGSPHLANFQSAVFYPLNILYLILPQITAWSLLVVVPFILAFIFMYAFLRTLECIKSASIIGAIAFAFCGFLATWTQENAAVGQAALWLPLMMYGVEKTMRSQKLRYVLVTSFAMSCSFLGGFYQITFYAWVTAAAYGLFLILSAKNSLLRKFLFLILTLLLSLGLCAIQLIPSIEAFFDSPRGFTSVWYLFDQYLLPLSHLIRTIFPDITGNPGVYNYFGPGFYHETVLYVGIIPLLFALFATVQLYKRPKVSFFIGLTIVTIGLTIKSPFTLWFFKLPLPLISGFLPSRIFYITSFALAVLSAFGVSEYLKQPSHQKIRVLGWVCLAVGIFMLTPFLSIAASWFEKGTLAEFGSSIINATKVRRLSHAQIIVVLKNMVLSWGLLISTLILTRLYKLKKIIGFSLILLTAISQFYFLNKYAVVGYRQFLYPEHFIFSFLSAKTKEEPNRFLALGRPIMGNVAVDKHIYTPEGLDAIFPYRYAQLIQSTKEEGRLIKDVPRIEVTLSELSEPDSMIDDQRRFRLLSLLGVKYLFYYLEEPLKENDLLHKFPSSFFQQLWQRENWYAYENLKVLSRAFLVSDYVVRGNPQSILDEFFADNFDPAKTVILEEKLPDKIKFDSIKKNSGIVSILTYQPEYVKIKTVSEKAEILFLSDNYSPGWNAFVDSVPTKVYRADYTFRAVFVPAGTHIVTFSYNPKSFQIGLTITSMTLTILFVGVGYFLLLKIKRGR